MAAAWWHAMAPPDRRAYYEWSRDHVRLAGDYSKTGFFDVDESRYLVTPFDLLGHDSVRMLNILKAPRTGGSLVGDVFFQSVFANAPGPFMCTFQTDPDCEGHYLTRIAKTFEASPDPGILNLFLQLRKKRELYMWPHMNGYFQGANVNSLQNKGVKYEWNDEVWCWKPGLLQQAFSRTEDYKRTCKILNISQASDLGSEWETVWNNGRRFVQAVRCRRCSRLQAYDFFARMHDDEKVRAGVMWDRDARGRDGRWNIARAAETTRYKCRFCGHEHADEAANYNHFNLTTDYLCLDPERSMVDCSVRWNALVGGDWWRLVKRFLQACEVRDLGSTVALENFYKKELATFWDPALAHQKVDLSTSGYLKEPVFTEGYKPTVFDWEAHRFITADYQDGTGHDTRHLIVTVRAWGDQLANRSRLLWEGRVNTFEQLYQLQLALGVRPTCVGIDGSFEMMTVAAQCAKYGWTMLIGDDADFFLHKRKKGTPVRLPYSALFRINPEKGKKSTLRGRARYATAMRWSNPAIKNILWNFRHGLTRHKWELPDDITPDYREGIDSETKVRVASKTTGVPAYMWKQLIPNNHPWDDECMQTVLALVLGAVTFDIEEDTPAPAVPAAPAVAAAPVPPHDQPEQLTFLS